MALTERLGNIPSHQLEDHGFIGMFKRADIYALTGADPWVDYSNPGPHRAGIEGTLTTVKQYDATELYRANKVVYNSQMNVKRAINVAMNGAVPKSFRRLAGARL